jgi:hypothetical protein
MSTAPPQPNFHAIEDDINDNRIARSAQNHLGGRGETPILVDE